ncbi:MAG: hypothetical protein C0503_01460 [Gemmatimonas sp.]|nr:hypothetical protein [Gemmatimonas sp.]
MKPAFARRLLAALFVFVAFGVACREGGVTGPDPIPRGSGRLSVVAMFELNTATNLVIEVTAPDIPNALIFNLEIVNGSATGSVTIPAGANRQILVRAFDGRTETHRGSRVVTIVEGTNPALSLQLLPLAGTVPVTVSFGVAVVSVTPLVWSLPVDSTVVFSATVMDATGAMQSSPVVRWASTDTRKLTVDSLGRATARDTGTVTVVAVSGGAAGRGTVTITPGSGTTPPSFTRTWVGGNGSGSNQTSWVNPNNWSPAAVPTANDSVVIGAAAFQPAIPFVDTLQVRDLTLLPDANLNMNGRLLTVVGGTLASVGGTINASSPGTFRIVGNGRLRGAIPAAVQVQGGGTVTLADSARIVSLAVSGTSSVFELAGRKLTITGTGTSLHVHTEGLLRMNNAADTLDAMGNIYIQSTAAAHAGNLTAGTFIVRGNIQDGNRYDASGTHRTVFLADAAAMSSQSVGGFDATARPTNTLQDVVIAGSAAWSNCSSRIRVRGSFTIASATTATSCTSYTMQVDGVLTTVAGSTLSVYGMQLGDTTGTRDVSGALGVEVLTFTAQNPRLRAGLAYRSLNFQRAVAIVDSIRTTGPVTISGVGSLLDVATPAGRAATFAGLNINDGASLAMVQPSDSLIVAGQLVANSSADLSTTLTAGTLRIAGNLSGSNFGASGTHLTVLDGASTTTWQDIGSMDFNARPANAFRNLLIDHTGIGVRNCFSNVRVTGAFRVKGTSTYSTCTSNFTRVDSLLATEAGTTVNAYGFTLANANGTTDVLGTWSVPYTDFTLANQPVRPTLTYQNLRFFASNTLPAGVSAATSLLVDGSTTVLTLSDGRVTTAALTTQSGARFAMNAGDTLRVTGAVNLNGGQSTPSGGVLEIEAAFNGTGYAPTGTHELRLRGAGSHGLSGFHERPIPILRVVSGTAAVNFMTLVVQDSLILEAGAAMNTATSNFVVVRGLLQTATGSTMAPYGVSLEGTATLQAVNGGFSPTILRVGGTGTGPGTALRNATGIQYNNVEFYTSYALSDSLSVSGSVYATGAGVVLDLNGRKLRAPGGVNFDANATGRMVNVADSLIVGNGANATSSLLWDSGTSGTVSAGTILIYGGTTTMSSFVATGTNRVIYTDTSFVLAARSSPINGTATFRRLTIRGQAQYTVMANFNTITVTDSLRVESGTFQLNSAAVVVDGSGQGVLYMGPTAVLTAPSSGSIDLYSATGTSLVSPGATFTPAVTRFRAANPVVKPSLGYQNVEFYGPATFSGNTNISGYLSAQNTGAGIALGGYRVNVGGYVDMNSSAFLVMNGSADTLDVTGDLYVDGGVASTLTAGVVLFRGSTLAGTNYAASSPHRTVFLGSAGAPQNVNGNTTFGRLQVAGARGFSANGSTYTVLDSLVVSTAVPLVGSGTLTVNGPMVASWPITISIANLVLRDATGTQYLQPGTNFSAGRLYLRQTSGLSSALRPGLAYNSLDIESQVTLTGNVSVAGNLEIGDGTNPTLTLAGNTMTVAGQVDVLNGGRLFMTNAADVLRTTGTGYTYFQGSAGTGSLTAGTLELSGNDFYPYSTGHAMTGTHKVLLTRDDASPQRVTRSGVVPIANLEIGGTGSRTISLNSEHAITGNLTVTSTANIALTQNGVHLLTVSGTFSAPATTTVSILGTLRLTSNSGLSQILGTATIASLRFGGVSQNQILPTDTRYVVSHFTLDSAATATMASSPSTSYRLGSGSTGSLTINGTFSIPASNTLNVCGGLTGNSFGLIVSGIGAAPGVINLQTTISGSLVNSSELPVTVNTSQLSAVTGC